MIKVFEDFDLALVGRMQSLLESNGIPTFLKNQFSSGVLGELPFVEIVPQLFIIEANDLEQAKLLLRSYNSESDGKPTWSCPRCREVSDGNFDQCWNCGQAKDEPWLE